MANDPAKIAEKWNAVFAPVGDIGKSSDIDQHEVEQPVEERAEPQIGKGNIIPSAGQQPNAIPTEAQQIGLAEQAGDVDMARRLKFAQLAKLLDPNHL